MNSDSEKVRFDDQDAIVTAGLSPDNQPMGEVDIIEAPNLSKKLSDRASQYAQFSMELLSSEDGSKNTLLLGQQMGQMALGVNKLSHELFQAYFGDIEPTEE